MLWSAEDVKEKPDEVDHSSGSDDDDGSDAQDESQYRITLPLDVRLAAPTPLFASPALPAMPPPHPSLPISHPPPLHGSLPAVPVHPTVHVPQLALQQSVHPLPTVSAHPPDLMSLPAPIVVHTLPSILHPPPQQQQQLMLPASAPAQLVRPPRCRDYDGECIFVWIHDLWFSGPL